MLTTVQSTVPAPEYPPDGPEYPLVDPEYPNAIRHEHLPVGPPPPSVRSYPPIAGSPLLDPSSIQLAPGEILVPGSLRIVGSHMHEPYNAAPAAVVGEGEDHAAPPPPPDFDN